ncbi:MAG: cytochrome o ubiquinol oxidase subunit III [Enterobacteriaceae bacterium]
MSADMLHGQIDAEHEHHDSAALVEFGFWVYLMSDLIIFACLFATFAVLAPNIADGPSAKEIIDLRLVLVETFALLLSSITYGLAMLSMKAQRPQAVLGWLVVTFLLGALFVGIELYEFHTLIAEGYGPQRSGFLSAMFTLVGTHGLHVTFGLIWMLVMMSQLLMKGITKTISSRLMCLSLFWHFLDIVWICVFTIVYLMGAM